MERTTVLATTLALVLVGCCGVLFAGESTGDELVFLAALQSAESENAPAAAADELSSALADCPSAFYCGPRWTIGAGTVILQRNDLPEQELVRGRVDGQSRVLMTTSDIDVDWGAGPWFEIIRHTDYGLDLEVEYFGIDNFTGSAEAHNGTPVSPTWYWRQFVFDDLRASYSNDLYSLEFNVQWPICEGGRWKGLAGFRWIELKEALTTEVTLTPDQIPITLENWGRLALDNHLYGFQLGAEGVLWEPTCRFRVEGLAKGGIYGNHADWVLRTEGDLDERLWIKEDCQSAFVSQLGLLAVYKPCCGVRIFGGYEALHLKEVVTASVQTKRDVIFDHVFYHGVVAGVEVALGKRYCGSADGCSLSSCN